MIEVVNPPKGKKHQNKPYVSINDYGRLMANDGFGQHIELLLTPYELLNIAADAIKAANRQPSYRENEK